MIPCKFLGKTKLTETFEFLHNATVTYCKLISYIPPPWKLSKTYETKNYTNVRILYVKSWAVPGSLNTIWWRRFLQLLA